MSNFLLRVLVAAVGVPLILFLVKQSAWSLGFLVFALQLLALREWRRFSSPHGPTIFLPAALAVIVATNAFVFSEGHPTAIAALVVSVGFLLLSEVLRRSREPVASLSSTALFLIYVVVPLSLWAMLDRVGGVRYQPAGALAVLLIGTWVCDTGAYAVGRAFGRHKLWEVASPNKTIEGFVAGVVSAGLVLPLLAIAGWASPIGIDYVVVPMIVGFIGQAGDLLESLMKREIRLKDSSSLLPGHGGILDRFDSLLLSTPFFAAYLLLTAR